MIGRPLAVSKGAKALIPESDFPEAKEGTTYVAPQVLVNVTHEMKVMSEETFGPVFGIMKVRFRPSLSLFLSLVAVPSYLANFELVTCRNAQQCFLTLHALPHPTAGQRRRRSARVDQRFAVRPHLVDLDPLRGSVPEPRRRDRDRDGLHEPVRLPRSGVALDGVQGIGQGDLVVEVWVRRGHQGQEFAYPPVVE